MNTPGQAIGNWQWRLLREQLDDLWNGSADYLQELGKLYDR
jgi:4-alpha-glucanotransferase